MSITAGLCTTYKAEVLAGVHTTADTYMIALYPSSATLNVGTTTYSSTGEVPNGSGYATGGKALTSLTVVTDSTTAILDFADASWAGATFSAAGALIYNASKGNKAVAVLSFGGTITSAAGTFYVTFPAPAAATGLIRI